MSHYQNVSTQPEDSELSPSPQPQDLDSEHLMETYRDRLEELSGNSVVQSSRKRKIVVISLIVLVLIAVAVAVPTALVTTRHGSTSAGPQNSGSGTQIPTSGTSGSLITMEDGTNFTYTSNFGGDWAADPTQPFLSGGKAQSWSPRIGAEEWTWGEDVARGVNLGGWLVTEPFIVPSLYEKYVNNSQNITVQDEWTLSLAMGSNLASEMENHYKTFITERDFAEVAAAGLNWVRLPIGFWAIEAINDEPFLVGVSWTYFLKAIQWARKYGIRIYLDLHALPGSQNGWVTHSHESPHICTEHSFFTSRTTRFLTHLEHCKSLAWYITSSLNSVRQTLTLLIFLQNGVMGIANAQRTLTYLRILVEFISQDQYRDVVPVLGIVNEILWGTIGETSVQSFYYAAYETIRQSTGTGSGAGPYIAIHEAFQGPGIWEGFLSGADRLALDQHPYLAFMGDTSSAWAIATNQSSKAFGVTLGGEFSTAINDCGLWLNGIGPGSSNPECPIWDDWASYNVSTVASLKEITLATMDALQNFFFWTWKIGNSTVLGTSSNPLWHYRLGLQQGWVPSDPRDAIGHCASILNSAQIFDGNYPVTATGGAGAGIIDPAQTSSHAFPPPSMSPSFTGTQMTLLPTYTATGIVKTLSAPTFTAAPSAAVGTGWNNTADNSSAYVPVAGCFYPDSWDAVNASLPTATCT
ncbi:exo-beta-1,3-glucanase [Lentinula detonsa]|uniref:glucan 1,3-beta-glucosidase n=1 Tax=Lentinula detonsa TaxID=2804962 RepID=A0AA38UQD8_9AGAR|nr:exo-beta-1,3-glucanase [Lentinula detonsa]